MPRVGFLVTQNQNEVLDLEHKTRLPSIIGWNLVRWAYEEFNKEHNAIVFENDKCNQLEAEVNSVTSEVQEHPETTFGPCPDMR